MGLLSSETEGEATGYEALEVTSDLATTLEGDAPADALSVRPDTDNGGIPAMEEVLKSIHNVKEESPRFSRTTKNASPAHALELKYARPPGYDERVITLQYVPGSADQAGFFKRQLQDGYPNSQVEEQPPRFLQAKPGQAIVGGWLGTRRYTLFPIETDFNADPTGKIIKEMVGIQDESGTDADVAVQAMFKPARQDWTDGIPNGGGVTDFDDDDPAVSEGISAMDLRDNLREPNYEKEWRLFRRETIKYEPPQADLDAADLLEDLIGKKAWRLCIRVVAVSDDPEVAVDRVSKVAGRYRNFYETSTRQSFIPQPVRGDDLRELAENAATRECVDHGIVKSQLESAGVVNVPESDHVSSNKFQWGLTDVGEGVRPNTPSFPFAQYGIRADAPRAVKQLVMIETATVGDAYWYGWGGKHGREAGVYDRYLNAHQFVPGRTRMGKTVALTNFASQAMRRYPGREVDIISALIAAIDDPTDVFTAEVLDAIQTGANPQDALSGQEGEETDNTPAATTEGDAEGDAEGGLIIDPKGQDGDEFIAEWPEDRPEEDLIVVDLDDENECIPRFNMLSIPSHVEPGTRKFSSYTNAVADVATMMVAEAGGSDNYVGGVMKRVTRTLARGMLKSGRDCTFLDLAACASYKGDFEKFSQWMAEDRMGFIAKAAKRMSEDNNIDLNPLAGRFDEYVQPDSIRAMISARDPTFSVQEAVDNGKWIVLIFPKYAGKTEVTALSNCYIAETYLAKLLSDNDAPYHLIGDEVHNFTTSESMLPHILSQGGGLNYRVTLACQSPANQLKDAERVRDAVQDNMDIWNTFKAPGNSSRYIASQYRDIDAGDLEDLTRYSSYLVQYTNEDEDVGTLIDTFPPMREVREEVLGDAARTEEEIQALKRRSMERYGEPLSTPDEQMAQSPFYAGGDVEGETESATQGIGGEEAERLATQAVYDTMLRQDADAVPIDAVLPALKRRLPAFDGDKQAAFQQVLQPTGTVSMAGGDRLTVSETDAETVIGDIGTDRSNGGITHASLMWDAYAPLTRAGLDVTINRTGGTTADAVARRIPDPAEPELVDRLLGDADEGRIESESTTGDQQPGVTAHHVCQGVEEGRRVLVLTRPEKAHRVEHTLRDGPPLCNSGESTDDETWFYTSTATVSFNGNEVCRPGKSRNVWVREHATGDIVLRDTSGTEHARFEEPGDVFAGPEPYPSGGENRVKAPVIPGAYDFDTDDPASHATIVTIREGAETLADLSIEGYPTGGDETTPRGVTPEDLDVPDRAVKLLRLITTETDEVVTVTEAHDLATDHGIDVSRRTVENWVKALTEEGALREGDYRQHDGREFEVTPDFEPARPPTSK